jgi:hypothetical protein
MAGALMKECKLCRRLFSSSGGRVCQDCYKYLDEIYPIVRSFIRDNSSIHLDVAEIADELELPIKYVQGLVNCGYLSRDLPHAKSDDNYDDDKGKLKKELQEATEELKSYAARKRGPLTYGQERYSTGKK